MNIMPLIKFSLLKIIPNFYHEIRVADRISLVIPEHPIFIHEC